MRRVPFLGIVLVLLILAAVAWEYGSGQRGYARPLTRAADRLLGTRVLNVTFWNVQWFPGRRPEANDAARAAHAAAVQTALVQIDPDVLGLEEVADWQAAALAVARLPGFRVDACSAFAGPDGRPTRQQIALCSRLPPPVAAWCEPWQPMADGTRPRRGFAFAVYEPTPGERLLVYAVHLKSNVPDEPGGEAANVAQREECARQLLVHAVAMGKAYRPPGKAAVCLTVLGGDFNTSLDDSRFAAERTLRYLLQPPHLLRWAWRGVPLERRHTLPAAGRYPAVCFDHQLYFSRAEGVEPLDAFVTPTGRDASDHRPVTVRYRWGPPE